MSGKTYTILKQLDGYPGKPMRYEYEVSEHKNLCPILRWSQDGFPDDYGVEGFINLDDLIALGRLAYAIKFGNPEDYSDAVEEWT